MPKISVIVPNYNHARYLPQRMDSILGQTYRDLEVIILDDASTDGSRDVIERYVSDSRVRAVFNAQNSGSVFRQWNRGASLACGDYLWLAESDDFCERTFLEKLVPLLDAHDNVSVAFCRSWQVPDGQPPNLWHCESPLLDTSPWETDYVAVGREQCACRLLFTCFIPNASSAIIRRALYEQVGGADVTYRICGDYHLWAKLMLAGDVAFVAEPLNYWRIHPDSVSMRGWRNGLLLEECYRVVHYIATQADPPPALLEARRAELMDRWISREQGREFAISLSQHFKILRVAWAADPSAATRLLRSVGPRMCRKGGIWKCLWRVMSCIRRVGL